MRRSTAVSAFAGADATILPDDTSGADDPYAATFLIHGVSTTNDANPESDTHSARIRRCSLTLSRFAKFEYQSNEFGIFFLSDGGSGDCADAGRYGAGVRLRRAFVGRGGACVHSANNCVAAAASTAAATRFAHRRFGFTRRRSRRHRCDSRRSRHRGCSWSIRRCSYHLFNDNNNDNILFGDNNENSAS